MKKSKFTGEQIAYALRQADLGVTAAEVCRKMGISIRRRIPLTVQTGDISDFAKRERALKETLR